MAFRRLILVSLAAVCGMVWSGALASGQATRSLLGAHDVATAAETGAMEMSRRAIRDGRVASEKRPQVDQLLVRAEAKLAACIREAERNPHAAEAQMAAVVKIRRDLDKEIAAILTPTELAEFQARVFWMYGACLGMSDLELHPPAQVLQHWDKVLQLSEEQKKQTLAILEDLAATLKDQEAAGKRRGWSDKPMTDGIYDENGLSATDRAIFGALDRFHSLLTPEQAWKWDLPQSQARPAASQPATAPRQDTP